MGGFRFEVRITMLKMAPSTKTAILLGLAIVLVSCQGNPVSPGGGAPGLLMVVHVSMGNANPGVPDTIVAHALNHGLDTASYFAGCHAGIMLRIIDAQSRTLYLYNPHGPLPECPVFRATIAPGDEVSSSWVFDGTLYDSSGTRYTALSGTYTAEAYLSLLSPGTTISGQTSFQWLSPANRLPSIVPSPHGKTGGNPYL